MARAVGATVGLSDTAVSVWNVAKWPVIIAARRHRDRDPLPLRPNVRQPKFRWISLGAVVALVVWVLASLAFGFYVANFASYEKTYGSLAGVIVFLLWLWITNLALLFGAELDAELERGRQLQGGIEAEEAIQLPPRDTRASEKKQAQAGGGRCGAAARCASRAGPGDRARPTRRVLTTHLTPGAPMYLHVQRLINDIVADEPDPAAANALQEGLGGQFGEMRTMMQYLFQSINFRGPKAKPYRDLLQGIGTEEISHVELIGTTIARLLDGSPRYNGKKTDPLDKPGAGGATPAASRPWTRATSTTTWSPPRVPCPSTRPGNPWSGSYVYNSGNLVLDLLYNLMLESTGRLQKCRIYEMTANKTARSTIAYLIVRDQAHENAYARALETLGVELGVGAADPEDERREVPRGQEAARPRAAEQAVHAST